MLDGLWSLLSNGCIPLTVLSLCHIRISWSVWSIPKNSEILLTITSIEESTLFACWAITLLIAPSRLHPNRRNLRSKIFSTFLTSWHTAMLISTANILTIRRFWHNLKSLWKKNPRLMLTLKLSWEKMRPSRQNWPKNVRSSNRLIRPSPSTYPNIRRERFISTLCSRMQVGLKTRIGLTNTRCPECRTIPRLATLIMFFSMIHTALSLLLKLKEHVKM